MKPVLLALAVILAFLVYELDRASSVTATRFVHAEIERALELHLQHHRLQMRRDGISHPPAALPPAHGDGARGMPAGSIEQEKSIRLFGPGVSRKQQKHV